MATATPYRWAKSAPPGSTLCPYCEVVYPGGGTGLHCATCGTRLIVLQQPAAVVIDPRPPVQAEQIVFAPTSEPRTFHRHLWAGFSAMARLRWARPIWITLLTTVIVLFLDRLILSPHQLLSSFGVQAEWHGTTLQMALMLVATALVGFGGGLVVGWLVRDYRLLAALFGGGVIAFAFANLTVPWAWHLPLIALQPILWVLGAVVAVLLYHRARGAARSAR